MTKKHKRKLNTKGIILFLIIIIIIIALCIFFIVKPSKEQEEDNLMINLYNQELTKANELKEDYGLNLNITYEYNDEIAKDHIISQSIKEGSKLKEGDTLDIVVSLGKLDKEKLASDNINELGKVPIMMYHGIVNTEDNEYTGGNVDKDGYNRTAKAFREDLDFYYENGYRMVSLKDYINGKIDTEYGKSPIVLTFDDGLENNIKVTGLDDDGNIIIDENSAVGILESFKKEHPDMNVTATFFVNGGMFNQPEYNEKILKWLVANGYDVGNHTQNHLDIKTSSSDQVQKEIAYVYDELENYIPGGYVNIIPLPYGSPYVKTHENYQYVLNTTYNNKTYETIGALRVGWEPEVSPFNKDFDPTFLKRCRAYDNNGEEFDIEMVFNMLETTKYISDGNENTIVTSEDNQDQVSSDLTQEIIYY
mgnify:FL=1